MQLAQILLKITGPCFVSGFMATKQNVSYTGQMRAVRKVFVHSEYLKNRSRGLDATWQSVRQDLTVHL